MKLRKWTILIKIPISEVPNQSSLSHDRQELTLVKRDDVVERRSLRLIFITLTKLGIMQRSEL